MVCFECLHNAFNEWQCKFRCVVALARLESLQTIGVWSTSLLVHSDTNALNVASIPFLEIVSSYLQLKQPNQKTQLYSKNYESNWICNLFMMSFRWKRIQVHLCGFSSSQIWNIAWKNWRQYSVPKSATGNDKDYKQYWCCFYCSTTGWIPSENW